VTSPSAQRCGAVLPEHHEAGTPPVPAERDDDVGRAAR
jgi:hypothetical protein